MKKDDVIRNMHCYFDKHSIAQVGKFGADIGLGICSECGTPHYYLTPGEWIPVTQADDKSLIESISNKVGEDQKKKIQKYMRSKEYKQDILQLMDRRQ